MRQLPLAPALLPAAVLVLAVVAAAAAVARLQHGPPAPRLPPDVPLRRPGQPRFFP